MDTPVAPGDALDFDNQDFISVSHIPGSKPSRYQVQIRRHAQQEMRVTQASEPMGRYEAQALARKWAHWHRLEVR